MDTPKAWLGLVALALVAAGCSGGAHHRTNPTTTSASSPSTGPPASAPLAPSAPIAWSRDGDPRLALGGGTTAQVAAVLPPQGSSGWLLAGSRTGAQGVPVAMAWTSPTGATWQATELPSPTPGSQVKAAAQFRGARVLVGSIGSGPDQRAAVWISPSPAAPFETATVPVSSASSSMDAVADGQLGFFASGTSGPQAGMWSSTNGQQWSESTSAEQALPGVGGRVNTLLAQGPTVYAAGSVADGTSTDAAVWASNDGIHWHQVVTAQPAFAGAVAGRPGYRSIASLAPLGASGLVAVGTAGGLLGQVPASWISPNGLSWSQPSKAFAAAPVNGSALSVAAAISIAGGTDLIATGGSGTSQRLWRSSDGLHWTDVALPPAAAASPSWHATLVSSDGATTVVVDSEPGRPHVLVRTGSAWTEPSANPAVFGPVQPVASVVRLAAEAGRLTLQVQLIAPAQAIASSPASTTIYLTTTNGRQWQPGSSQQPTYRVDLPPGAVTAARVGTEWVAAGRLAGTGAAWVGPDGVHWHHSVLPGSGAHPLGVCGQAANGESPAVRVLVGWADLAAGGTAAASWSSTDGVHWAGGAIQPAALTGGAERMIGCTTAAEGFLGYGETSGAGGSVPAVWRSTAGQAWTLESVPSFTAEAPAPIDSLVRSGQLALAVSGSALNSTGLWVSRDSGSAWEQVSTDLPPWDGYTPGAVRVIGAIASDLLVAGTVDGQLAVWLGTPTG